MFEGELLIKAKAKFFAKRLGVEKFSASNGCLMN